MRLSFPSFRPRVDPAEVAREAAERAVALYRAEQEAARAEVAELARQAGSGNINPFFGELAQSGALASAAHPLFARDHPWRWRVPQAPAHHPGSIVSVETLRLLADTDDVIRACIAHLQREVTVVPTRIVARDEDDKSGSTRRRIQEAQAWFEYQGGIGGCGCRRRSFEYRVIDDLCVVGAAALYFSPTRGGGTYEVLAIDAATIRPRVDAYGWPGPGENWYEQWVEGIPHRGFTPEEMCWDGLYPRTWSPFPASPTEWVLEAAFEHRLQRDWDRYWLSDGNEPGTTFGLPDNWTPDQVIAYATWHDARHSGDIKQRTKVNFVPAGSLQRQQRSRHDMEFLEGKKWNTRRTCSIFGVSPTSIGYEGQQYKVSTESSQDATTEFGVGALLEFRADLYNEILRRLGYEDLRCENVEQEEEDAGVRADRNVKLVSGGVKTPNEARGDEGLDAIEGGDTLFVSSTLVPIEQAIAEPEPVEMPGDDPEGGDVALRPGGAQSRAEVFNRWERKALNRLRRGQAARCEFVTDALDDEERVEILERLADATDAAGVRAVFTRARELGLPQFAPRATRYEREQIGVRWRDRRLAAEREGAA